jgi:hypothetical protein
MVQELNDLIYMFDNTRRVLVEKYIKPAEIRFKKDSLFWKEDKDPQWIQDFTKFYLKYEMS